MTVTISRLYDNHNDAQRAVRRLEFAGAPHSDISMVANNSDNWFNTDKGGSRPRWRRRSRRRRWERRRHWCGRRWHCRPSCRARLAGDPRPRTCCRSWLVGRDGGRRSRGSGYRRHCRRAHGGWRFGRGCPLLRRGRPSRRHAGVSASGRRGAFPSRTVLNEFAINLHDRSAAWQKAGWKSFDPASKPYDAEEIQKERKLYGGARR